MTSVKKIASLFGWTLASLRELNWRPWKLSKMVVELNGAFGLTKAKLGGTFPLPEVMNNSLSPKGVPPLTIWISGVMGI